MKMHIAKLYIPALMLLISFACSHETAIIPPPPADEYVDAVIHISSSSSPSTYALTEDGEGWIKEIDLLAFKVSDSEEEYYAYRTQTTDIDKQEKKITVSVKKSVNDEQYRFVIIANASAAVNNANFTTLATKKQVYERIISELSGNDPWDATETTVGEPDKPIPMWGEAERVVVTEDLKNIPTIHLLRALARIDVVVLQAAQKDFRLTDIFVYNTNRKGRVIPEMEKLQSDGIVSDASIPADNNMTKGPIQYTIPPLTTEYKHEIYLYEAAAVEETESLQATCLVIGGYYDNGTPESATKKSYYRVDFFVDKKNNNLSFKPILRNHCYTINIANVLNEGYETEEDAFDKRGINMEVVIQTWADGYPDGYGGSYNFVINRNLFANIGTAAYKDSFLLTAEEPTEWTSVASEGVKVEPSSGMGPVTGETITFTVASESEAPSPTFFIEITSGPITKRINITR
jgi:hypothetical protein